MSQPDRPLAQLFQNIVQYFDMGELRALSLLLNVDWDTLSGDNKPNKAISLITHLSHRQRIDELVSLLREKRPRVKWPDTDLITISEADLGSFLINQAVKTRRDSASINLVESSRGGSIKIRNSIKQEGVNNEVKADLDGEIEAGELDQKNRKS